MKIAGSFGIYKTVHHTDSYCYLMIDNDKVLNFYMNNSSYFEITTSLF